MPAVQLSWRADGPAGAPVLVLGGPVGTTMETWSAQVPALSRHFRVIRFEHRGHGVPGAASPAPAGPYTIAELGADVLGLLSSLGVQRAAYAGVSLGGMIGIWLAANAPERISSLAICCAALVPMPSAASWRERAALVAAQGTGAIAQAAVARWFTPQFTARSPQVVAGAVAALRATSSAGYAGCAAAIAAMDLHPLLPLISAPALVLSGADDVAAPPWMGAQAALAIGGSRLTVVRGAAHFAHVEAPGPVTDALLRHLRPATAAV